MKMFRLDKSIDTTILFFQCQYKKSYHTHTTGEGTFFSLCLDYNL